LSLSRAYKESFQDILIKKLKSSLSNNNADQQDLLPICPRCESDKPEIVSFSPVKGAWIIYNCPVCIYSWRSAEPDYATKPDRYNPAFKIKMENISTFAEVPVIPALRLADRD